MSDNFASFIVCAGLVILIFMMIIIIRRLRAENGVSAKYDERQTIARGQAYKVAFFTLLFYIAIYACVDALGFVWCETSTGMTVGIFLGVTVFAVFSICTDSFNGIHNKNKGVVSLCITVILAQLIGFVGEVADDGLVNNGLVTSALTNLTCAVCFMVILIVYLIHEKRAKLPEEDE